MELLTGGLRAHNLTVFSPNSIIGTNSKSQQASPSFPVCNGANLFGNLNRLTKLGFRGVFRGVKQQNRELGRFVVFLGVRFETKLPGASCSARDR